MKFSDGLKMVVPFWADVKADAFSGGKNVFWQVYDQLDPTTNQDMLQTIKDIMSSYLEVGDDIQRAYWALVVTWSGVQPNSKATETNTFQVVLLTDSIHSYAMFNYDPCNMNWDTAFLPNKNVILGYTCGESDQSVYVDVPEDSLFRPGTIVGNSGKRGRWVFQLDSHTNDFFNPRLSCHNWYSRQAPYPIFNVYYPAFADTCPCSMRNARRDLRFLRMTHRNYVPPGDVWDFFQDTSVACYVRLFQAPGTPGPQCCYKIYTGDLLYDVRNPRVASVFERFPFSQNFYTPEVFQKWYEEEVFSRYYCCEKSNLCHLYIEWRPLMTCSEYTPPFGGWFWGDPHVRTLDGLDYTFNGLGEYTLVLIEDPGRGERIFELQGRTQRVYDANRDELTNATSYIGFAALDDVSGARVEVKINKDATDLITTVNGNVVEPTVVGLVFDGLTVKKEDDPPKVVAIFASDTQFSVGVNNSLVDITVHLSQNYKGKTKGLLGVWDGNSTNDVLRRDGAFQQPTGTDGEMLEVDYFEFGETWRVSINDSHFYYLPPDESWDNMNDLDFRPKFLDDLLASVDAEQSQKIIAICGDNKECQYDSLVLNDTTVGVATLELNEKNTDDLKLATNYPPMLTLIDSIDATVGESLVLQLSATDPDGDHVEFRLLEDVRDAVLTEDGVFTWLPMDTSKVRVGFLATDGRSNSTLEPIVSLCDCKNGGTCLSGQYVDGTNLIQDRFGVLLCKCEPGWSGEFCEVDYDACADDPCFLGVDCKDEAPPLLNSTCGPCPEGLEGDGKTCADIDECVEMSTDDQASSGRRGCDQICENTLGGFKCRCRTGYFLDEDGKTCLKLSASNCLNGGEFDEEALECICPWTYSGPTCADENRCLSNSSLCSELGQQCLPDTNEEGFSCQCRGFEGYVKMDNGSCKQIPSIGVVITANLDFKKAFKTPTSNAFERTASMFERAIMNRLATNETTWSALSAEVTKIEEGSVVVTSVVSFPESTVPSAANLEDVLSRSKTVFDGNVTITIDPDSVRAKVVSTACASGQCLNGGTCERPHFSPWLICRCQAAFTGERCETEMESVPSEGGMSTVALVTIIIGTLLLVLVVVAALFYITLRKKNKVEPVFTIQSRKASTDNENDRHVELELVPVEEDAK
ncbi:mucin-like protein [Acanthaster planci]|uniref:Mucin-like protein n=1 Tax=Acanthaster planci TaxID=133434 RepID=A0A8B7ZU85_ACAPL|nr:mucin-like protein [Acanthaster planci]